VEKRTVMIVDHQVDAARALAMLVRVIGGVAHVVHDGPSAIALAKDLWPDVVLLEISMPGVGEVCRHLRAEQGAAVKLVALGPEEGAQDIRFDAHLAKPPPAEVLRRFL
jgi:CheY-like chemotaxis protein